MKTRLLRNRESGMAVVVILTIISIVLVYVGANSVWLSSLDRELKLIERQQIRRLNASTSTNLLSSASAAPDQGSSPLPAAPKPGAR